MGNASSNSRSSSQNGTPSATTPIGSSFLPSTKKSRERSASSATLLETEALVDGGHTLPLGLYQVAHDFSQPIVRQLIQDRKLAPFYQGLEEYEEDWDVEEIVAALREAKAGVLTKAAQLKAGEEAHAAGGGEPAPTTPVKPKEGPVSVKEQREATWYPGAAECPLCFLYYPSNLNTSRCCDQPICTECFVQIKRAEATATHLESEPACCPFCMEPNFGIVYTRPKPRPDLLHTPHHQSNSSTSGLSTGGNDSGISLDARNPEGSRSRRKSVNHMSRDVVTIDEIRPDWEAKLAAVKAVAARRANRRIVMRQVGDRLIPVGITSSRDPLQPMHLGPDLTDSDGGSTNSRSGRRGTRRGRDGEIAQMLQGMGIGVNGPDIEELMMMEAMRLSLLEHEKEQEKLAKEEAEKKKNGGATKAGGGGDGTTTSTADASSSAAPSGSSSPTKNTAERSTGTT